MLTSFAQRFGTVSAVLGLLLLTPMAVHAADYGGYGKKKASEKPTIVETAVSAGQFNTLVAAVKAAGLVDTLSGEGPFTVFAPTDAAFAELPEGTVESLLKPENRQKLVDILTFHVVPGKVMASDVVKVDSASTVYGQPVAVKAKEKGVYVEKAKVVKTDIVCGNGVIHVIDQVIMPQNIVGFAAGDERFSTLVAAVKAAGLAETLSGEGPFTVFAPTNAAFGKLPEGTVENLLKPENRDKLTAILTYHVLPGKVMAADVKDAGTVDAKTVGGPTLEASAKNGGVMVNNAKVVIADVNTTNGVIHAIDTVLLPPSE